MGIRMRDVYAGDFMKAEQLLGSNGEYATVRVTINGARQHEWDDGKKQIVISFKEDDRSLGLNITNADTLKSMFGSDDSDSWMGKQIELYVDKNVMFGGKKCPAIRIREVGGGGGGLPARPPASGASKVIVRNKFAEWVNLPATDPSFAAKLGSFASSLGMGLATLLEDEAQKLIKEIATCKDNGLSLEDSIAANVDTEIPF